MKVLMNSGVLAFMAENTEDEKTLSAIVKQAEGKTFQLEDVLKSERRFSLLLVEKDGKPNHEHAQISLAGCKDCGTRLWGFPNKDIPLQCLNIVCRSMKSMSDLKDLGFCAGCFP